MKKENNFRFVSEKTHCIVIHVVDVVTCDEISPYHLPDDAVCMGPINPLGPHDALRHIFHIPENKLNLSTTKGFRMKISLKLAYQYVVIFFNFYPTSNHLHPLQVENCDSNSRLVVDEDDNSKFRPERVNR